MSSKDSAVIQGTIDSDLSPEYVLEIGKTLGMQYKHITIGTNMNPSSKMVLSSLIAGMTSTGADVRDAGVLPAPAIPFCSGGNFQRKTAHYRKLSFRSRYKSGKRLHLPPQTLD